MQIKYKDDPPTTTRGAPGAPPSQPTPAESTWFGADDLFFDILDTYGQAAAQQFADDMLDYGESLEAQLQTGRTYKAASIATRATQAIGELVTELRFKADGNQPFTALNLARSFKAVATGTDAVLTAIDRLTSRIQQIRQRLGDEELIKLIDSSFATGSATSSTPTKISDTDKPSAESKGSGGNSMKIIDQARRENALPKKKRGDGAPYGPPVTRTKEQRLAENVQRIATASSPEMAAHHALNASLDEVIDALFPVIGMK